MSMPSLPECLEAVLPAIAERIRQLNASGLKPADISEAMQLNPEFVTRVLSDASLETV